MRYLLVWKPDKNFFFSPSTPKQGHSRDESDDDNGAQRPQNRKNLLKPDQKEDTTSQMLQV